MGNRKANKGFWSKYFHEPSMPWPMAVRSVGYNRYRPGIRNPLLHHPWHHWLDREKGRVLPTLTIVHVIKGEGTFRSKESGRMDVPEKSLLFVFPNVRHYYGFKDEVGWDDEWLEVEPDALLPLLERSGIGPSAPVVELGTRPAVEMAFRRLFDLARNGANPGRMAACAYETVATMLEELTVKEPVSDPVEEMKAKLSLPDFEKSSMTELAVASGLSASRMRALFRKKTGLSPKRFQLRQRLGRAAKLLSTTGASVADIAAQTGFGTIAAFSASFSREFGMSPSAYRRR